MRILLVSNEYPRSGKIGNQALAASSIYAAAIKKAPNLPVYDENGIKLLISFYK